VTKTAPAGVITGGLKGIGAAAAVEFGRLGARLLLLARSLAGGEELCERVRAAGGEALLESADVRDPSALERVAARAVDEFGRIDFLLANAGIADQSRVSTGDPERWRAVVETNLLGVAYSARAVLPQMLAQNSGHIFIMSSVSGRESYVGEPVYMATKWGQVGFTHALRLELLEAGSNIRVTIVEPGLVDTPLTRDNPVVRPLLEQAEPLTAEDVARAVVYAYQQPERVLVSEITLRPLHQVLPQL
jgi:NADP-dependent 3-hydroxy acid dehydrogenase YdfG